MINKKKTFYEQEIERLYQENPIPAQKYILIRQSKALWSNTTLKISN